MSTHARADYVIHTMKNTGPTGSGCLHNVTVNHHVISLQRQRCLFVTPRVCRIALFVSSPVRGYQSYTRDKTKVTAANLPGTL